MSPLGKRILVFTMLWVLLAMVVSQVYDNITGRGLPAPKPTPEAATAPDADVQRLADLQSCVASDPTNLNCTLGLASLYYQARQWPQAQSAYERAIVLSPHDPATLLKLAGAYIYQDNFEKAIPTLEQAASLKPDSPEIYLLLGLALSKAQPPRLDDAAAAWKKVIQIAPGSAWASQAQSYLSEAGR